MGPILDIASRFSLGKRSPGYGKTHGNAQIIN
jgi:hypothetical protein